ncbi:hypothetical protein BZG36_02860 [Bifiguratus adelaidae]|uniref:Uncharacterized protein n=1 Tax=Bifiguratus adelaidae TaxID=1938954 RepID=A0A261Y0J5_9FUNG|nr:hypothetical protein BZG36_02860 [Bifiguratus adelaidae]
MVLDKHSSHGFGSDVASRDVHRLLSERSNDGSRQTSGPSEGSAPFTPSTRSASDMHMVSDARRPTYSRSLPSPRPLPPPRTPPSHCFLRGHSFGVFGPDHHIRLVHYKVLTYRWTEPFIFCLISLHNGSYFVQRPFTPMGKEYSGGGGLEQLSHLGYSMRVYGRNGVEMYRVWSVVAANRQHLGCDTNTNRESVAPSYRRRESLIDTPPAPPLGVRDANARSEACGRSCQPDTKGAEDAKADMSVHEKAFLQSNANIPDIVSVLTFWIDLGIYTSGNDKISLFKGLVSRFGPETRDQRQETELPMHYLDIDNRN